MDRWMDGYRETDGWVERSTDGWVDIDGWMDGWKE